MQRRLLIHFLQYTRCRQGSFPPLKLLIGKINPPVVSSLTIHSPREFNSGQQRRTATYTCDTLFFRHSPALLTSSTHLFPVNPDHVANIKSRCSSIAPHHCLLLSDIVPFGLVIQCIHKCNLAFPLLLQGCDGLDGVRHHCSWTMLMIISVHSEWAHGDEHLGTSTRS